MRANERLTAVARRTILGETSLRYKRNVMILSLVVAAIHVTSFVDFSTLNIFGVRLAANTSSPRGLALTVLGVALTYPLAGVPTTVLRTGGDGAPTSWIGGARTHDQGAFPSCACIGEECPLMRLRKALEPNIGGVKGWKRDDDGSKIDLLVRRNKPGGGEIIEPGLFSVPVPLAAEIREQGWMALTQVTFALVCIVLAVAGLVYEAIR
jgi:hypothetical protein